MGSKASELLEQKKQQAAELIEEKKAAASELIQGQINKTKDLVSGTVTDAEKLATETADEAKKEAIDAFDAEVAKTEKKIDEGMAQVLKYFFFFLCVCLTKKFGLLIFMSVLYRFRLAML